MDKEKFIPIYINYLTNVSRLLDIKFLLETYIEEKKKENVKISVDSMMMSEPLTHQAMEHAIQYYVEKFGLRVLTRLNGEKIII